MNKDEFYQHLGTTISRPLSDDERDMLDIVCVNKYRSAVEVEFIPLEDVPVRISQKKFGRWLYDRKSATWICNVPLGSHEHLAGTLYNIYSTGVQFIGDYVYIIMEVGK